MSFSFFILLLQSWLEPVHTVASSSEPSPPSSLDSSDSQDTIILTESPSRKRQRVDTEAKQVRVETQTSILSCETVWSVIEYFFWSLVQIGTNGGCILHGFNTRSNDVI